MQQSWQEPVSFGGQSDVDVQEAASRQKQQHVFPQYIASPDSKVATTDGIFKNNGVFEFLPCHENNTIQRPA